MASLSEPLESGLSGLRVLLAEDEFHVLLLIEDVLVSLGCNVVETVSSLEEALERAECCNIDAAVLDINLNGMTIYPAAAILRGRGIPIVFSTGYGLTGIDPEWAGYPVVQKPFLDNQLAHALRLAIARARRDAGIEVRSSR